VPEAAPTVQELDAYRERADRFIAEEMEEYYLHFAGLKEEFELEQIYARYADLTDVDQVRRVGVAVDGDPRVRELWKFSCEGFLGALTREQTERAARLETELKAEIDGEEVPYRMLRPTIANEPDRDKRRSLEEARNRLNEEHLNPVSLEAIEQVQNGVHDLGSATYLDLYRRFRLDLDGLADQCRELLDSTERVFEDAADRLFRSRVGLGLDEVERWDVSRAFRAPQWDSAFPADKMVPALEKTLGDLGVDLRRQANVELDVEQRPTKSPRAFCAPIEVPGRVVLVIQPVGGPDDWRALFHEAGHTEHFANTSPELPLEGRRLGDNAVTEGWASLFEQLTAEPAWTTRRLDFPRPEEFAAESATVMLWVARRYAAKLLYELEFHAADDVTELRPRYVELLSGALKVAPSDTDFLADVDAGFYVSAYLRSWAFEAQMRDHLRGRFGNDWFTRREAGGYLRELWSEGQRLSGEEMIRDVTGGELEMTSIAERIRENLTPLLGR
jgi:hypothetical protein